MSIDKSIYSELKLGHEKPYKLDVDEDIFIEEYCVYEKDNYQYLDRLEKLNGIVNNINIYEVNIIIDKWKPEEAVRYLFGIINKLKQVS